MKMNKEQFLKTEFGGELESTITAWDDALSRNREDKEVLRTLAWCQAQWEVYRMAIKHFYGVEYHFTRTDEYYGLCTEDESDWLMRVKRVKLFQMKTMFSRQRVTRRGIRIDGVEYWDDDFVHLNLGKTVIAECTPWLIRVYTEAGTPLHISEMWKSTIRCSESRKQFSPSSSTARSSMEGTAHRISREKTLSNSSRCWKRRECRKRLTTF